MKMIKFTPKLGHIPRCVAFKEEKTCKYKIIPLLKSLFQKIIGNPIKQNNSEQNATEK